MTLSIPLSRPARLRCAAILLLVVPSALSAQRTRADRPVPPVVAGCPFTATLPSGWQRVPPLSARVNSARHMRLTYGAGPEDVVLIDVRFSSKMMAGMQQQAIVDNGLMAKAPELIFAGKPAAVLRSTRNADALAGRGGTDVWNLFVPWEDDQIAILSVTAIGAKGTVPPTDATIRALLGSMVPGACLADEDPS